MIPRITSEKQLSQVAISILFELRAWDPTLHPDEGTLYRIIKEQYSQFSPEEMREGLAQLLGKTPEHTEVFIERAPNGGYYVLPETSDATRGHVILAVKENQFHDGANYFHIINDLRRKGFGQELIVKTLKKLTQENLLVDTAGRFSLNPGIPEAQYEPLLKITATEKIRSTT